MNSRTLLILLALILELLPGRAFALYPVLDGFRVYSTVSTSQNGVTGVRAIAVQPLDSHNEAKILVGGAFQLTRNAVVWQNLVRLLSDGTRDTTFNATVEGTVSAIALQPDNGIIIGGSFTTVNGISRNGLARLGSDGSLDAGFNPVSPSVSVNIKAITLQKDDSGVLTDILVGGDFPGIVTGKASPYFARVSPSGSYESSPGFGALDGEIDAILLQDAHRILVGGSFTHPAPSLARFLDDVFTSFNPTPPGGAVLALAAQADGKILVAGGPSPHFLTRLNDNGTADSSFAPNPDGQVTSIAVQPDGAILVAGDFTNIGSAAAARLARLSISDGSLDPSFVPPGLDAIVHVIALQLDGKPLAGGEFTGAGGKPRTALARFYPGGTLDTDLSTQITFMNLGLNEGEADELVVQPDGKINVLGTFVQVEGVAMNDFARLKEDGSLDSSFPSLPDAKAPLTMALFHDQSFVLGQFWDTVALRVAASGAGTPFNDTLFNTGNQTTFFDTVYASLVVPGADGAPLEDEMVYLGGDFYRLNFPSGVPPANLLRFKRTGELDPSFAAQGLIPVDPTPWDPDWSEDAYNNSPKVYSIAIQRLPDANNVPVDKILVSTYSGHIMRLNSDGSLDPTWQFNEQLMAGQGMMGGPYIAQPLTIAVQSDGQVLVAGEVWYPYADSNGVSWKRSVLRLSKDGVIDNTFNVQTTSLNPYYDVWINGIVLQTDGSMLIGGLFDAIKDSTGNTYNLDSIARILPNGVVDPDFNVGSFLPYHWGIPLSNISAVNLQSDGKILFGGRFDQLNGDTNKTKLSRLSNKSATQVLSVSQAGSGQTITWQRKGTGPELWMASFEYYDTSAMPAAWKSLGRGERTAAKDGWEFDVKKTLPQGLLPGTRVRARGYTAGDYGSAGSLMQSEFLYYPQMQAPTTVVTVTVDPGQGKTYGDPEPASFSYTPSQALPFTGALSRVAGENVGSYAIGLGTLALSGNYSINLVPANFSITPLAATVTAESYSKVYGTPDPPLIADGSGFLPGDLGPGKITFSATRNWGGSVNTYDITPAASDNGTGLLANYLCSYLHGTLEITPLPVTITAHDASRYVGDPNPVFVLIYPPGITPDDLGAHPLIKTTADQSSPAGTYPIVLYWAIPPWNWNYSITLVNATLTVYGPFQQSISFPPLRPKTFGDGDFDPGASADSGLPVSYASSVPAAAAVVGGKLRIMGPGRTDITASQAGDAWDLPAPDVVQSLTVNPPPWNGLGFDGIDDLMWIADAPQLNFGAQAGFSIETWLHLEGSQPDGTGLVSKGGGGGAGYQLILHQDRIAAQIGDGALSFGVAQGLVGTRSLNDGAWHHVALSVDRALATASLYLDGRLEVQLSDLALAANPDNAASLQVGVDAGGTRYFKGELDELRLWSTARSRDELRGALSQIIDPSNEPQLAAYFHFDEGDVGLNNALFATAPERTAYGALGTLQGFALNGASSNWVRSGAFLPLLETTPVTLDGAGGASCGAVVYPNYYPPTERGLCWGTAANPGLGDSCRSLGAGSGSFSGALGGLAPGNVYHVRGYARNTVGTAYGNDVSFSFLPAKLDQTISLPALPVKSYGDPDFDPGGTSSSGLPVSYASSDPTVATVVGGQIRITGAGTSSITASQGGDANHNPASTTATLTVNKALLTVTADDKARSFGVPNPPLTAVYTGFVKGETFDNAKIQGSPGLATSASQDSPVGGYPITVSVGQLSAPNYSFTAANGTLNVAKSCQEIIFPAIGDRTYGDPPFVIQASACSGLGISFSLADPSQGVATISGNILTITGAGSVVVTASQQGSGDLDQATQVSQAVVVHKKGQAISFPAPAPKVQGDPPFTLNATASSALPVSYQSSDPGVVQINGSSATVTGAGTTVITAWQPGNANYNPALPSSQPLTVAEETVPPVLTLSTLSSGAVTANPVLNIMGSASDASQIASLTVNGADLTDRAALFSSAVLLAAGKNSIEVSARDGAGNLTTQTLSITLDAAAPEISLSAPADNSMSNIPACAISGTVTPGSSLTVSVNGSAAQTLTVTGGAFTGSASLNLGVNTIEFCAALSGRVSRVKRSVTLAPGQASLAITEPAQDLRTEQASLSIGGTTGGAAVLLEVSGSSFSPPVQGGAFQQTLALDHAGVFRITASVTDAAGNKSVAQRNIIRVARILGDLNGDGCVDLQDALAALRISLGMDPASAEALAHGDVAPLVNGVPHPDGVIDAGDVLVILRKIVGLVDF